MGIQIEALPNSITELGEAPHWVIEEHSLYYVDIMKGNLLRYDQKNEKIYCAKFECESNPSFIIPIEGQPGKFVVGAGHNVVVVAWNGIAETAKIVQTLAKIPINDEKFKDNCLNDGKCDPYGRLLAGTFFKSDPFGTRCGELYKFTSDGQVTVVKSDIGCSNGLTWNEKAGKFYYIDTLDNEVKEYDYDIAKGVASNPKVLLDLRKSKPEDHLQPDGITIDTDGNLYVAVFNGHVLYKVQPSTGKILLEIKFPCKHVTSCAFGGPNLDILYVTTASWGDHPSPAGSIFKVTGLGARGLPMNKFIM